MRSRPLAVLACLAVLGSLAGCGDDTPAATIVSSPSPTVATAPLPSPTETAAVSCDYPESGMAAAKQVDRPSADPTLSGEVKVTLATSVGKIGATLDADATPCTVNSFVSLAEQDYFNGTSCHRLTDKKSSIFVLQCGDPTGTGTGGPGYTIPDELQGDETYPAGTLAMAKTAYPDSGGSQFFIVYADTPLPPQYTVFGQIDEAGIALVEEVAEAGTITGASDGPPATPVDIANVSIR